MGRSRETFNKKKVRTTKEKKRKDKLAKKQQKKETEKKSGLDDMLAYVDAYGNITSTPPEEDKKVESKLEDIEISVPRDTSEPQDLIREGVVEMYDTQKGFGFIRDSISKESVFFHVNNTRDDVSVGNRVSFEMEKGPKGMVANNVGIVK
ncbi:MAG: cold shock domain-containing protein [Bacteroidales bacterium]|nr:cold shock domain-containing protein [Bacteroidales bacterium]